LSAQEVEKKVARRAAR